MLGCHGQRRYGFSMCKGTKNVLLDLSTLGDKQEEVMEYLDSHCKLFEQVLTDHNGVNNAIYYIIKQGLVPEHMKTLLYSYINMHKDCGLYMYIEDEK